MSPRPVALLLALAACGDPPRTSEGSATVGEATSTSDATTSASASTTTDASASTGASGSTRDAATIGESESESESDTTGPAARCGDGLAEPGELCLLPARLLPAGVDPVDLVAADLDRDGHLDLAVADVAGPQVLALYGDGLGGFRGDLSLPGLSLTRAVAAIVTADGAPLDLVHADLNFSALGHHRAGARPRTYALPTATALGDRPRALLAADLDGDGDDDLVVVSEGSDEVIIAFHEGGEVIASQAYAVGVEPYGVALGDLDGDGLGDLALVNRKSASASVLLGEGAGAFLPAVDFATAEDPRAITLTDLDEDGHLDLAIACYEGQTIQILRNAGDGLAYVPIEFSVDAGVYAIAADDLDHDGRPELAAVDFDGGELLILRFAGEVPTIDRIDAPGGPFDLALEDFDGDGSVDVAIAAIHANGVHVLLADP